MINVAQLARAPVKNSFTICSERIHMTNNGKPGVGGSSPSVDPNIGVYYDYEN